MTINLAHLCETLTPLGFELHASVLGQPATLQNVINVEPVPIGPCSLAADHLPLIRETRWLTGQTILASTESQLAVIVEPFVCFGSPDFPEDLLVVREFFEYELEEDLRKFLPAATPTFTAWFHLFHSLGFRSNWKNGAIAVFQPAIGNVLYCRGEDVAELLGQHNTLKGRIAEQVPLPIVWGFPVSLPLGRSDYIYSSDEKKWYVCAVRGGGPDFHMSLADLRHVGDGGAFRRHGPENQVADAECDLTKLRVHISEVEGGFRSWRRFSRITFV